MGNYRSDAANRGLELIGVARKAQPHETLAARPEGSPGREPDVRFIDQPHHQTPRVGFTVDSEEQIERARGPREAHATGRTEHGAGNIASAPRALDQMRYKAFAALDRRYGGTLHERRDAGGRILDHVLDYLPERGMARDPANTPAGHRPVLGERIDEQDPGLWLHHIEERRRARNFTQPEGG